MTNVTLQFLNAILPDEGLRVAAWSDGSRDANGKLIWKHSYHGTNEELSHELLLLDQRGFAAYHACSSFVERGSRKSNNVHSVQSLWLDVDAGPGKPYSSATTAYAACESLVTELGLPTPLYVASGNGLHVYWPLSLPLSRGEWQRYAAGLKALCARHGLHADPSRTADAASILRPPGTHNRKNGEVLVQMGEDVGCFDLDQFSMLLGAAPAVAASAPKTAWLEAATNTTTYAPADPLKIAEVCRHVAVMEETGGDLPEPYWYDLLGVLAFCEDVEVWAHEWSRGYEGYSYAETQAKLEQRKRAASGATTCVKIEGHNPALCNGCPLKGQGRSPISIGRDASLQAPPVIEETGTKLPIIGHGFSWGEDKALWFKQAGKEDGDEDTNIRVTDRPIVITNAAASEGSFKHTFRASIWGKHDGFKEVELTADNLLGNGVVVSMAEVGVSVLHPVLFKRYAQICITALKDGKATDVRYEQFGWRNKSFIWGTRAYVEGAPQQAFPGSNIKQQAPLLGPKGDKAVWARTMEAFLQSSSQGHALAVLASFAAPLMSMQDTVDGGCILSLSTGEGGKGKSTALLAAASVWGAQSAMILQKDDTSFSQAGFLRNLRNLPVMFDEKLPKDTDEIHKFVDMFSSGREKVRGKRDGGLHEALPWQTILISASNYSLAELAEGDGALGGRDAPRARIFEIRPQLDIENSSVGDSYRRAFQENYGLAGHEFLSVLTDPKIYTWARQTTHTITDTLIEKLGMKPHHRYWSRLLGCLYVANVLVKKLGLLQFDFDKTMSYAIAEAKVMIAETMPEARAIEHKDVAALSTFFNENNGKIYLVGEPAARYNMNQIVARQETDVMWVSRQAFSAWLRLRNIPPKFVMQTLEQRGLIDRKMDKQISLAQGTGYKGPRTLCFGLKLNHPEISGVVAKNDKIVELKQKTKPPAPPEGDADGRVL